MKYAKSLGGNRGVDAGVSFVSKNHRWAICYRTTSVQNTLYEMTCCCHVDEPIKYERRYRCCTTAAVPGTFQLPLYFTLAVVPGWEV